VSIMRLFRIFNIVSILVFLFYVFVTISAAYERPAFDTALTAKWHPGGYCIPCHYSLMNIEKARSISNTCSCHDIRPRGETGGYNINMTKIYDIHNNIICIRCHIGIKNPDEVTVQDFHRIMKIACSNCHTYANGTYQVPEKTNCSDCHAGGNPHTVHGNKTEILCIACHGEDFAKKYADKTVSIPDRNVTIAKQIGPEDYPTVARILSKIIGTLMKIGE
jgi:hypothetical protein